MDRISTGIVVLDNILQGGFPEGTTILIVGRPGSGKTILAHQIMFHNASPEHKAIYLTTLSEPQVKVMKFQQEFSYFDQHKFQRSVFYRDLGSILRKLGPAQALVLIDELLRKHQPRLIVMDTVRTIAEMIPSHTEFREFLLDLSMRLATWGCTALLLGEYCEEEVELRPESAIADGILYLSGTEERNLQKRYLRILKMRGTDFLGGENVFQITADGIQVFPRINSLPADRLFDQSLDDLPERLGTGLPGLDEMMGGGIPRGTATLVSGASGTGKTLLALNFATAGLESGESAVYVTFEEHPRQILDGARRLGLDLGHHLEAGRLKMLYVSPMELDVDINVYQIQKLVHDHKAARLVIDSISAFEIGMNDKIKYTDYIWALTDYFKAREVSVLLTHEIHNGELFEMTKHGVSYVADNLILLRFLEQGLDLKRYLRVVKMRASSHTTMLRELLIGPMGISLAGDPNLRG